MLYRSVRANHFERTKPLPGDDLTPQPIGSLTHAITTGRPRHEVWPWLAQMGAGSRAGWYSYDFLDNGRRRSAKRILPELQCIAVGTLFPALPGATDGFVVVRFELERFLVLGWPAPDDTFLVTWALVLDEAPPEGTRLIARARAASGYPFLGLPAWLGQPVVRFMHFVMQRKQLLGIASRVEDPGTAFQDLRYRSGSLDRIEGTRS
jgi:hypothetical protein